MFDHWEEEGRHDRGERFAPHDKEPTGGEHDRHHGKHHEKHRGKRHGKHHGEGRNDLFREAPGGRPRVFDQGELRFVLLGLIEEAPRHGYEIIKAIEERLGGTYSPSPGVIYPTLTLLHELGYTTVSESVGGRRLYTITEEGSGHLGENRPLVESVFQRMARASAAMAGGRAPQVVRAIENMKTALRLRLSRGPLQEAEAEAIADALDAAARAIERA